MKNILIYLIITFVLIGIIIVTVQAASSPNHNIRISPRCDSQNGTIDVDWAYKNHSVEGYIGYIGILKTGRCERMVRGEIRWNSTVYIPRAINQTISATIANENMSFYPDPFKEFDVDGRGFYIIT